MAERRRSEMNRLSNRQKLEHRYAELWEQVELPKLQTKTPTFFQESSKEECQNQQRHAQEISFRNFDRISESLHPPEKFPCEEISTESAKRKTDENNTINQSGTSKDEQTAPCKTLHPKHLKRHKNPITQVYLKLETILISRQYHLSKQTQRQLTQIYLNGDDNHE